MYTPALKDELVRKLYQLKQLEKKPMTVLLNEAVEQYLSTKQFSKMEVNYERRN